MADQLEALDVRCPICDAYPGRPCEDVESGWVTTRLISHLYRIAVAEEVAR